MNKLIIIGYASKLKKEDIRKFSLNQGIEIKEKEVNLIYDYIKHDIVRILNRPIDVISEIKNKVSKPVYDKILELYSQYKNKIS